MQALVAVLIGGPVLAGLLSALALSLGLPDAPGFDAYARALSLPGVLRGFQVTLITGLGATLVALLLSVPLGHWAWGRARGRAWLAPVLALPHAALALGLAFLLAPSGWIARLLAGVLGWVLPPAVVSVGDAWGLVLMLGLILKETPFLVLMTLSATSQIPVAAQMRAGQALGHAPGSVWRRVIWPQLLGPLRLPVFVTLAFSLSVADMALLLGPTHPPTLAVQILRLFTAPDPALRRPAAALSVLLIGVMLAAMAGWRMAEPLLPHLLRLGPRRNDLRIAPLLLALGGGLLLGGLVALALWSVAQRWPWPAALPEFGMIFWRGTIWLAPAGWTLGLGLAATLLSLLLAIALLEAADRSRRPLRLGALLLLPLLVPQIGFLPGLTMALLRLGLPPGAFAVLWAELVFTFPYALIALAGPWQALDREMLRSAASLGAGPWRCLLRVKLPLLARPIAAAAAVVFAVSAAQYLAVLLPGAGRIATLGTEAVALASGADRRAAAGLGLMQTLLPLLAYAAALAVPERDRAPRIPRRKDGEGLPRRGGDC